MAFLAVTLGVPTLCYAGASVWLAIQDRNYPDALMFGGYAFANVGVMWRLLL